MPPPPLFPPFYVNSVFCCFFVSLLFYVRPRFVLRIQRGSTPSGSTDSTYQQLLATDVERDGDVTPPGSPALRGFRKQKRRVTKNIGGGVESLWRHVSSLSLFICLCCVLSCLSLFVCCFHPRAHNTIYNCVSVSVYLFCLSACLSVCLSLPTRQGTPAQ